MEGNEKRPAMLEQSRGEISLNGQDKDTNKLSKRQNKVFDLLRTGKHSVADITIKLGYSDPRAYIRVLRGKGINILDEWVKLPDSQYKRYWIVEGER